MFWLWHARMTDCVCGPRYAWWFLWSTLENIDRQVISRSVSISFVLTSIGSQNLQPIKGIQSHLEAEAVLWKSNTNSKQNCFVFERSCPALRSLYLTRIHFQRQSSQAVSSCLKHLKLSHQFEVPIMPAETDKDGMLRCAVSLSTWIL